MHQKAVISGSYLAYEYLIEIYAQQKKNMSVIEFQVYFIILENIKVFLSYFCLDMLTPFFSESN